METGWKQNVFQERKIGGTFLVRERTKVYDEDYSKHEVLGLGVAATRQDK